MFQDHRLTLVGINFSSALDNQHSLTVSLGIKDPDALPITIATIFADIVNKRDIDPAAGIIHHEEGIDLMPANNTLTGMEISIAPLVGREILIKKYLNKVKHLYDYIIIDTSPSVDILATNALVAADSVIIPVTPKFLDAKGLELLLRSIADVREDINPNLDISGILLTMVDMRTNFAREIISLIENAYGANIHIFNEHVPHSIRAAEASATGKSIFSHDPSGKVAAAYAALAREVLNCEKGGT